MSGIGERLADAREARGLTLEQVERETRIIRRYLAALEAEDFDAFPAEVYARGFLRSYATYLGLNAAELLAHLPRRDEADQGLAAPAPDPTAARARPRPQLPSLPALPSPPGLTPLRRLALAVALLLVGGFVVGRLAGAGRDSSIPNLSQLTPPPAGAPTRAPSGPTVAGLMPDLQGQDLASALAQLRQLGVTPVVIETPSRAAPAGQVIRQSPAPRTRIGKATVTLIVSKG